VATLTTVGAWFGAFPDRSLTLVDPPWRSVAPVSGDAIALDRIPWLNARGNMAPELAVARAISRRFWRGRLDTVALPAWFLDGLTEYVARRAVVPIFAVDNLSPGYSFLEVRYFSSFVPSFVRIRLLPETDGTPASAYRLNPAVAIADRPVSAAASLTLAGKALLVLGTLEQWVGRPVFDEIVAEFAHAPGRPTLGEFERIANATSGQDLSWLFDEAFRSSRIYDYGVADLRTTRDADGSFNTTIVAARFGEATFTGSAAAPIDSFESGRGIALRVTFADGQVLTDAWDGRARDKTFRYRSPAPAVSAAVDPERRLLLDLRQSNNSKAIASSTARAATRWSAMWLAWLEHALLTSAALS